MLSVRIAAMAALVALGLVTSVAIKAETGGSWGDCPVDKAPNEPECGSQKALVWVDCPARWPGDGKTPLLYGELYNQSDFQWNHPFRDRYDTEIEKVGFFLDCEYGTEGAKDRKHLTVEAPSPLVQWGWHDAPEGKTVGMLVPRSPTTESPPTLTFPERVSMETSLHGMGLNRSMEDVEAFAKREGFSVTSWSEDLRYGLYRPGIAMEVLFDPQTRLSREVILRAGWQDADYHVLVRKTFLQFGFDRRLEDLERIERFGGKSKEVWYSADRKVAVELWRDRRPKEAALLRLVVR